MPMIIWYAQKLNLEHLSKISIKTKEFTFIYLRLAINKQLTYL